MGGQIEIEIIQGVTNRPIIIIRPDGNPTIPDNLEDYQGDPIFIYYNGHTHYDAFIINNSYQPRKSLAKIQKEIQQGKIVVYNRDARFDENYSLKQPER